MLVDNRVVRLTETVNKHCEVQNSRYLQFYRVPKTISLATHFSRQGGVLEVWSFFTPRSDAGEKGDGLQSSCRIAY